MSKSKIEKAIKVLRDALREKYGEDTSAQLIIKEDSVSLDDDDARVVCDELLEDAVSAELEKAGK